jgi:hypothetical protein
MEIAMKTPALPPVIAYELAAAPRGRRTKLEARGQRDGSTLWGIFEDSNTCLTAPGVWEYEPMPSSRDDDYLARSRRTLAEALELWRLHLVVVLSGGGWSDEIANGAPASRCEALHDPTGLVGLIGDQAGRPQRGSWIGAETLAAARTEESPADARELAIEVDTDLRRAVGLAGDAWFREGTAAAVVATGSGFEGGIAARLSDDGMPRDATPHLLSDLRRMLAAHGAFPVGLATMSLQGDAVVATVSDRRPGIDV